MCSSSAAAATTCVKEGMEWLLDDRVTNARQDRVLSFDGRCTASFVGESSESCRM
jgi:hypothetical protein